VSNYPTTKFELTFDDEVVELELEFKFSENADEFLDVGMFVQLMTQVLLASMSSGTSD
jgi:hypothetical protein